jgi:signal peptidase I
MPGLGHVYAGAAIRGVIIHLIGLVVSILVAAFTWHLGVFFLKPAIALVLLFAYAQVWVAGDAMRLARKRGRRYLLRPYNNPLVYVGLVLGLLALPVWFLGQFATSYLVGDLVVRGSAAVPQLVAGDSIYYDRGAYASEEPERGDLVVVQRPDGEAQVLRVAGVPGDVVGVRHGAVVLNDVPVPQERLGTVALTGLVSSDDVGQLIGFRESADSGPYEVFYDASAVLLDTGPVYVGSDQLFLLADNRTGQSVLDSRQLGPFSKDQVLGRPLYVWFSREPVTGDVRWSRIGLRVH